MLGMSISRVITLFLLSDAVTSYWLALTFQANHVVEDVVWPMPDENVWPCLFFGSFLHAVGYQLYATVKRIANIKCM